MLVCEQDALAWRVATASNKTLQQNTDHLLIESPYHPTVEMREGNLWHRKIKKFT
jgi:hypothetical protein